MAEQKEDTKNADRPEKGAGRKRSRLRMILLAVPLLLLGASAGTYFLFGQTLIHTYLAGTIVEEYLGRRAEASQQKKPEEVGPILTLDPFIFNLSGNATRFAKVSLAVGVKDQKVFEEAKKIIPILRDRALVVLSGKTPEVLIDVNSRGAIKQELHDNLKALFRNPDDIRSVYVTDIIIP